jgi:hypothetical protein
MTTQPDSRNTSALLGRLRRFRTTRTLVRDVRGKSAQQARAQESLKKRLDSQAAHVQQLTKRLTELERAFEPFVKASNLRALEHGRFSLQVGAMEARLGELEQRLGQAPLQVEDGTAAEALRIVDVVRREHEQIRVRMQIISSYEERLRRVEETVACLYDGDLRHQV